MLHLSVLSTHPVFLRVEIVSDWKLSFIKLIFSLSPSECLLSLAQEGKLPQETRPEFLFLLRCLPKAIKLYFAAFKGSQLSGGHTDITFWTLLSSTISKTRVSVSSGYANTEKQMKAQGCRPTAFIVVGWMLSSWIINEFEKWLLQNSKSKIFNVLHSNVLKMAGQVMTLIRGNACQVLTKKYASTLGKLHVTILFLS